MSVLQTYGPVRRRILTPYVLVWVAAAALATGYLALLGVRPDIFARSRTDVAQELAQTKREVSRAMADLDPLRRTVGEIKLDVANLKFGAKELATHQNEINDRVTALEAGAPQARVGEAATEAPAAPAAAAAKKPAAAKAATKTGAAAPVPAIPGTKVINGYKASPESVANAPAETGSIADQAHPKVAAVHKPATPPKPAAVGVLLATGPSVDALRLNWTILKDRHSDVVKSLSPRYVVSGPADKRTYSLVAGPISSAEQAKSVCRSMAEKGAACEVANYRGNAL
jgi:hypothetical protein